REQLREDVRGKKLEWLRPDAVPALHQMLMAEDAPVRRILVELLTEIPGKRATTALASRAVFDLSPDVRAAAIAALKDRPVEHWRPMLLSALRYPWPPPADFAAEALVTLKDVGAIPELIAMLRMSPASRPHLTADKRTVVREVVRINHLNNCMLCNPPALRGDELVLAFDPVRTIPKKVATNNPALAQRLSKSGAGGGGGGYSGGAGAWGGLSDEASRGIITLNVPAMIRADITFLPPDFSVGLPGPSPVPAQQPAALALVGRSVAPPVRFDYLVRTRPVKAAERKRWEALEDKS